MMHASLYNLLMTNKQLENTKLPSNQGIQIISTKEKKHNFIVEVNSVT
jgi:hypothetical protein